MNMNDNATSAANQIDAAMQARFTLIPTIAEIAKPAQSAPTAKPIKSSPGGNSMLIIVAGTYPASTQTIILPQPGNSPCSMTEIMAPKIAAPINRPSMIDPKCLKDKYRNFGNFTLNCRPKVRLFSSC